jgi:hypothetical protein
VILIIFLSNRKDYAFANNLEQKFCQHVNVIKVCILSLINRIIVSATILNFTFLVVLFNNVFVIQVRIEFFIITNVNVIHQKT